MKRVIFTLLFCTINFVSNARNLHNGISIALNDEIPSYQCENAVKNVKTIFTRASDILYKATKSRFKFESLLVIVPASWDSCGHFPIIKDKGYQNWESSSIRIGKTHSVFGDQPWTLQPRQCGFPGNYIRLSIKWLLSKELSTSYKGSLLAHEWSKYRWGVFEEYGHYGDPVFPESTKTGKRLWEPNFCTDTNLDGEFSSDCKSNDNDCKFRVANDSNVSSSLMSVPAITQVFQFCDKSTHRKYIPTKHNLICNNRDVWEVISQHSDFTGINNRFEYQTGRTDIDVEVVRENYSRNLVIAFEVSQVMAEVVDRFSYLREFIAQFIQYEVPSSFNVGLVSFSSSSLQLFPLSSMSDSFNRKHLAKNVIKSSVATQEEQVNLLTAIKDSVKLLGPTKGIILLVTKCIDEDINFSSRELASEAAGHPVWTILYPMNSSKNVEMFNDLASLTGGKVIVIEDKVVHGQFGKYISPQVRQVLSKSIRQILNLEPDFGVHQIYSVECDQNEVECHKKVPITPDVYSGKLLFYAYHVAGDEIDFTSSIIQVKGGSCAYENFNNLKDSIKTTNVEKCNIATHSNEIDIKIVRKWYHDKLILELVGRPNYRKFEPLKFKLFSSGDLLELQYTRETAPILFVQIFYNKSEIYGARVSVEISSDNEASTPISIYLKDDGIGADVTGNDAVYSGHIIPILPAGEYKATLSIDDFEGRAKLLPMTYDSDFPSKCCGSVITLPENVQPCPNFSITFPSVSMTIKSEEQEFSNLPPGQIKDLKLLNKPSKKHMELKFTAPGADLDYGKAKQYILSINYEQDHTVKNYPKSSGSIETIDFDQYSCDEKFTLTVRAVDNENQYGLHSNPLVVFVPCSSMTKGAKIGLIISIILIVILLMAACIFLYKRRGKNSEEIVFSSICCDVVQKDTSQNSRETLSHNNLDHPDNLEIRSIDDLVINLCGTNIPPEKLFASESSSSNDNNCSDNFYMEIAGDPMNLPETKKDYAEEGFTYCKMSAPANQEYYKPSVNLEGEHSSINKLGIPLCPSIKVIPESESVHSYKTCENQAEYLHGCYCSECNTEV